MNGAGNGTPGQKSGYHIGQICRTSARHARCSSTVAVVLPGRETVTATELDSDVAVCANAKEVAQIMTKKAELIMAMMCAEYYGADIKLIKLIIFIYYIPGLLVQIYFLTVKVNHCCRKHYVSSRAFTYGLAYKLGLISLKVTI